MKPLSARLPLRVSRGGFSLVELLVVLVIASILSALAFTAFNSIGKADNLNAATSNVSLLLEQARAYAMANNTYVFVGFAETDGSALPNGPQTAGIGRVALQAFASLDGTLNLAAANLSAITRLQILGNVDMPGSLAQNTGTLAGRPAATYSVGNSTFPAVASSSAITSRNFTFTKIIAFDAMGVVHIPTTPPTTGFQYLEIDLQPANGNIVPANNANVSAVQVDGTTGVVNVYRS